MPDRTEGWMRIEGKGDEMNREKLHDGSRAV
ncbi:uncharacterized, partial [Tachysurus ichikawai]